MRSSSNRPIFANPLDFRAIKVLGLTCQVPSVPSERIGQASALVRVGLNAFACWRVKSPRTIFSSTVSPTPIISFVSGFKRIGYTSPGRLNGAAFVPRRSKLAQGDFFLASKSQWARHEPRSGSKPSKSTHRFHGRAQKINNPCI